MIIFAVNLTNFLQISLTATLGHVGECQVKPKLHELIKMYGFIHIPSSTSIG